MHGEIDGIEPEAIDTALKPETRRVEQRFLHGGVIDIEIGLGG